MKMSAISRMPQEAIEPRRSLPGKRSFDDRLGPPHEARSAAALTHRLGTWYVANAVVRRRANCGSAELISALPVNLHLCGRGSALVSTAPCNPRERARAAGAMPAPLHLHHARCALSEVLDAYLCTFAPHHLARTGFTDQRLEDELLRTQQGIERQE